MIKFVLDGLKKAGAAYIWCKAGFQGAVFSNIHWEFHRHHRLGYLGYHKCQQLN